MKEDMFEGLAPAGATFLGRLRLVNSDIERLHESQVSIPPWRLLQKSRFKSLQWVIPFRKAKWQLCTGSLACPSLLRSVIFEVF